MALYLTFPKQFYVNSAGQPYPAAKMHTYRAGTTTNLATYTTATLGTPHANPVVADANGIFPAIYVDPNSGYDLKVVLKDQADVTLYTEDNIPATPWNRAQIGQLFYPRTAAEIAAGVTPTYYYYEPGDARRYGLVADGATDDRTALVNAMAQGAITGGATVRLPAGTILIGSAFTIPGYVRVVGAGQGLTTIKRGFTGDFITSQGGFSQLENLTIEGDTATRGAGRGILIPASNPRQRHINISVVNFVEPCLEFATDGGSEFVSEGCRYYTTGTVGTVAAVKGPSVVDSAAVPRKFYGTASDGCTLFDFGACDHWWADGFYTNGLIFSSASAFNVGLDNFRAGALGGTVTVKGDSHFIRGVAATAWVCECTSSIIDVQAPSWNTTESGSAANNSIKRTNPSYTCTWTGSGSNPALGNGTLTNRFSRDGAWVDLQVDLTPGSTTTFGSGTYEFSLPIAAHASAPNQICGSAILTGASAQYLGVVRVVAGASVCRVYVQATDTTIAAMTESVPITFANADNLRFNCRYRVA